MGAKGSVEKDKLLKELKEDLAFAAENGFFDERFYKVLGDGNLMVQTYKENGSVKETFIVHVSLGRTLTEAEWKEPNNG